MQKTDLGTDEIGDREVEESTCSRCGEKYNEPLRTMLRSRDSNQEYYACPRCLTKVGEIAREEKKENEQPQPIVESDKADKSPENGNKCQYQLGYLKNRPKNTPIPDQCLVCDKMVECLST